MCQVEVLKNASKTDIRDREAQNYNENKKSRENNKLNKSNSKALKDAFTSAGCRTMQLAVKDQQYLMAMIKRTSWQTKSL